MAAASASDVARATAQGTVLAVEVDGTRYGKIHYVAPGRGVRAARNTSLGLVASLALAGVAWHYYAIYKVTSNAINDQLLLTFNP